MAVKKVTGQYYSGFWMDIGTPERLTELDQHLRLQKLTTRRSD